MRIDLNAARAARAEQEREPFEAVIGDPEEIFVIPHPLDWLHEIPGLIEAGDLAAAFELMLGDRWAAFQRHRLTIGDLEALMAGISNAGGLESPGESSASNGSSPNGLTHSKPTSNGSTASTSPRPSRRARAASPTARS